MSGIEYVHKLGIVHRDLKPENLLLDKNKNIKIVDFGLSNLYKNDELLKTACGSPCYAAPEMIAGKKYVGLRVDIWSAGVILYAMVCGYLPFDDPDTQLLYKKIMSGDYSIPSHVSSECRHLIKTILNTDPEKRITIDQIRNHPWYKVSTPNEPQGIIYGFHKVTIDEKILSQVSGYGYEPEEVRKYLNANKHNKMTTLYYLLMLKMAKTGYQSPADVNNPLFCPEVLAPKRDKDLRDQSVDRSRMNRSQNHSRSDSISKANPREMSETRIPDKKPLPDSLSGQPSSASRAERTRHISSKARETRPPAEFVTRTHQRIENKTKAPNLARLNNTTFDEGSQMGNRLRSPGVSISPGPKHRDTSHLLQDSHNLGHSMDLDASGRLSSQRPPPKRSEKNPDQQDQRAERGKPSRGPFGSCSPASSESDGKFDSGG